MSHLLVKIGAASPGRNADGKRLEANHNEAAAAEAIAGPLNLAMRAIAEG
jgi:hypothetical protein